MSTLNLVSLSDAQKLTSPNPFCLVGSSMINGDTNLMAVSWWTYLSNRPAMVAVSLSCRSYSNECIRETGEFTISVVDKKLAKQAMQCGTSTGRLVSKAKEFGIELCKSNTVNPCYVKESSVALECRVVQKVLAGDHTVFISEVTAVHTRDINKTLYAVDGYRRLASVTEE